MNFSGAINKCFIIKSLQSSLLRNDGEQSEDEEIS